MRRAILGVLLLLIGTVAFSFIIIGIIEVALFLCE